MAQKANGFTLSSMLYALGLVGAMFFALCSSAEAQQPKKPPRLGYLSSTDQSSESKRANVIRMGLRDIGYLDGQNLIIEYRYGGGKVERLRGLAEELVALNVDMILVAGGGRTIRAAKNATKTTPLIMVGEGIDPVGARLVESLARPGGNITGVTSLSKELGGKRLELLKEAVPKLARVVAVSDPAIPNNVLLVKEIQAAAGPLGLTVQPLEIRTSDDFDKVFAEEGSPRCNLRSRRTAHVRQLDKDSRIRVEQQITVNV